MLQFTKNLTKEYSSILIILFAVLFISLPFLSMPIYIDDIYILTYAREILKDPLDPYGIKYTGEMTSYTGPPLLLYYAALVITFFGESEIFLHIFYIIFTLMAGISMFFLSKKFSKLPLFATLLMISTPIFVVMSNSLMQDVPVLAFLLTSLVLFIKGVDENNWKLQFFGCFIAGITFFIKYNGMIIIPLIITYSLLNKNFKSLKYLFITFLVISIVFAHNLLYYGSIHFFNAILPWLGSTKSATGLVS